VSVPREPRHPNAGAKKNIKVLGHLDDGPVSSAESIDVPTGLGRYGHPNAVTLRTDGSRRVHGCAGSAASRYPLDNHIPAYMDDPVSPSSGIRVLSLDNNANTPQFALGPRSGQDFACFLLNRSGHVREQETGTRRYYDRYMPGADPRRNPGLYCRYCVMVVRLDGAGRLRGYPGDSDKCPISPTFSHETRRLALHASQANRLASTRG
jgi:hypothetical protein